MAIFCHVNLDPTVDLRQMSNQPTPPEVDLRLLRYAVEGTLYPVAQVRPGHGHGIDQCLKFYLGRERVRDSQQPRPKPRPTWPAALEDAFGLESANGLLHDHAIVADGHRTADRFEHPSAAGERDQDRGRQRRAEKGEAVPFQA